MPGPEVWDDERVASWLRRASSIERQFATVSGLLFEAAGVQPGESVLDVGCGAGPTTREVAGLVGPAGRVVGLDLAPAMVEAAAAETDPGLPVEWAAADAQLWNGPPAAFDLVVSRFGLMFFAEPGVAMANLARVTRSGGRLAAVVWARRGESEFFDVPYRAAVTALAARGVEVEPQPDDVGPFAWHDESAVTALLAEAGWESVSVEPRSVSVPFGGGVGPAEAARAALDFGSTRVVLEGVDEASRDAVAAALEAVFADHVDADGTVVVQASVRVVTASRG